MPDAEQNTMFKPREKPIYQKCKAIIIIMLTLSITPALFYVSNQVFGAKAYEDCCENVRKIGTALEMYSTDNAGHYPQELKLLTPYYLKTLPTCPSTGSSSVYEDSYVRAFSPDAYTFCCKGNNHTVMGIPPDYPSYNACFGFNGGMNKSKKSSLMEFFKHR